MLPIHFGPWQTIYWWFHGWSRTGTVAPNADGRLLMVIITPANISDSAGAQTNLHGIRTPRDLLELNIDGGRVAPTAASFRP